LQYAKEIAQVLPGELHNASFEYDLHDGSDDWGPAIECCDAVILTSRGLGAQAIARAANLRFVQKLGVAAGRVDIEACRRRGVTVSVLPDAGHVAVAEHTIMMMLAMTRQLATTREALLRGENPRGLERIVTSQDKRYPNWLCLPEGNFPLLADLTLGLVGFGEIAREVCARARALGMRVLYTKRTPLGAVEEACFGVAFRPLPELLGEAHFVSLHATLPDGARPLIGSPELACMRADSVIINTSRGNQVDETALQAAIENGCIRGAALDVFQVEPVEPAGLASLPQVLATPHTAGIMPNGRRFRDALLNIRNYFHGGEVYGKV